MAAAYRPGGLDHAPPAIRGPISRPTSNWSGKFVAPCSRRHKVNKIFRLDLAPSRIVFMSLLGPIAKEEPVALMGLEGKDIVGVFPITFDATMKLFALFSVRRALFSEMEGILDPSATAWACALVAWQPHLASDIHHQPHSVC